MIRLLGHYIPRTLLQLALLENAALFVAWLAGVWLRFGFRLPYEPSFPILVLNGLLFAIVLSSAMLAMGLYQRHGELGSASFAVRFSLALVAGSLALIVLGFVVPALDVGRGILGLSLAVAFGAIVLVRWVFVRAVDGGLLKRRLLVLGAGANARRIKEICDQNDRLDFVVVGYVPLDCDKQLIREPFVIRKENTLWDIVIEHDVDEIIVAADEMRGALPVDELIDCRMSGFEVLNLPSFFEKELALIRTEVVSPHWLIFSEGGFRTGLTGLYGKHVFDLTLACVMLLLAGPVMALVALASLIESRGRDPILYHQVRVGENGRLFRVHKFRSMRVDAEGDGVARWAAEDDPRITRLGAFLRKMRLDELPQIFNVLKGQMSLVGPRPERPDFVAELVATIPYYAQRHRVKPGITGWAQLLYPYGSDTEDAKRKLEYDLYYVKHASIVLDLIIILQTVEVVLFGKGAR